MVTSEFDRMWAELAPVGRDPRGGYRRFACTAASSGVPTAMLFVRNQTGVSHSPAEFAECGDCLAGVTAFADALADAPAQQVGRTR